MDARAAKLGYSRAMIDTTEQSTAVRLARGIERGGTWLATRLLTARGALTAVAIALPFIAAWQLLR